MTHTEGPWHACHEGKCPCKQVWGDDHPIATVECGDWGDDYPSVRLTGGSLERKAEAYMEQINYGRIDEDTARANARLIAAAPELLHACQKALRELGTVRAIKVDLLNYLIATVYQATGNAEDTW